MVLPVAALPFLGILGGAVGAAALGGDLRGHVLNRQAARQGKYQSGVMEGVDQSDPSATAAALFGGGLLDGPQYQADARSAFEGQAGRDAAMQRSQVAQALGWAKWNHALATDDRNNTAMDAIAKQTGMPEIYAAVPQLRDAWVSKHAGVTIDQMNRTTRQVMEDEAAIASAEVQILQGQDALDNTQALKERWAADPVYGDRNMPQINGPGGTMVTDWGEVSKMLGPAPASNAPAFDISGKEQMTLYSDIGSTGQALDTLEDAISYVGESWQTLGGVDKIALEQRLQTTVGPALQKMANAGTLDQAEYERLKERLSLDGVTDDRVQARLGAMAKELQSLYEKNATMFENATTPEQRDQLGYSRRASGSAARAPEGTVAGAAK